MSYQNKSSTKVSTLAADMEKQLTQAASKGDYTAIKSLLIDINREQIAANLKYPLLAAARYGQLRVVKQLLAAGANVNCKSSALWTPLMWATIEDRYYSIPTPKNGHIQVLKYLLKSGAKVNMCNCDGETALTMALNRENHEAVKLLKEYGAEE